MNGQDANTALQEVRARFAALKTLSGLQARLLAAFQEKNADDGLTLGEIGKQHGAAWVELKRFVNNQNACCSGKAFEALIAYTGQAELGEQTAACLEQLPGDTWRGFSRFDVETIDHLHLIWEAYTRDAKDLRCEDFSRIFPEEMRRGVYGTLIRKREDAGYFTDKDAQATLFAFLASDAYNAALAKCHEELAEARKRRSEEWQEPIKQLEELFAGRAAQAKALGVGVTTINSLLNGTTAPDVHVSTLKKAMSLIDEHHKRPAKAPEVARLPPGKVDAQEQRAIAVLKAARARNAVAYSISTMATRMNRPRQWLSRVLSGENAMPDNFAEMARQALPELFDPPVDTSERTIDETLRTLYPEEHSGEAATEEAMESRTTPPVDLMPESLVEATIGIGMSSIRTSVVCLETWQEAMPHGLSFSPKQRADMARYAARLIRLSGLTPAEASLAITGEPVTAEDLRGVFGAIQQEDRQKR